MGNRPIARLLPTPNKTQKKRRHAFMPSVGFEHTIPVFEGSKTIRALHLTATAINLSFINLKNILRISVHCVYLYVADGRFSAFSS
jgi:hypothetical protein